MKRMLCIYKRNKVERTNARCPVCGYPDMVIKNPFEPGMQKLTCRRCGRSFYMNKIFGTIQYGKI
jgi:transposase-like protein